MSGDHLRAAASAYDAAMAQLVGCKGLLTAPLTGRKLALLTQRLGAGADYLSTSCRLLDAATVDAPYLPPPCAPPPAELASAEPTPATTPPASAAVISFRRRRP